MRRASVLLLALVARATAQADGQPVAPSAVGASPSQAPVAPLSGCQTCCSSGGSCAQASHGTPGICCGRVNGAGQGYCCAANQKCVACRYAYRCFQGFRPPSDTCDQDGGFVSRPSSSSHGRYTEEEEAISSLIGLVFVCCLFAWLFSCLRRQMRPQPALAAQQGVVLQDMSQMGIPAVPAAMGAAMPVGAVPVGRPIAPGQPVSGAPVAMATACPVQGGCVAARPGVCAGGAYPMPVGYGYGGGYGGGTVAMGAGMGFLGGMMMGEALAGHHGGDYGGDYGGGGDFGGGGGDFGGSCAADF